MGNDMIKVLHQGLRDRLMLLATSNLSDAIDQLKHQGIHAGGAVIGIVPQWGRTRIVGEAVTVRVTAHAALASGAHLGVDAIAAAKPGDVIVVDNRGDLHNNCWGEILSMAARMRELSGVVVDGAVRDVDACEQFEFPVHARGTVPITARGRIMQEAWNVPVRLGDIAVRPGDIVMADVNGVVVIRVEALEQTLERAEAIAAKEQAMIDALRAGEDVLSVDKRFNYENMLKPK